MKNITISTLSSDSLLSSQSNAEVLHLFSCRPPKIKSTKPVIKENFNNNNFITISNVLWTILVGWWVGLITFIFGIIMSITVIGFPIGKKLILLSFYIFYPFGYYAYYDDSRMPNIISVGIYYMLLSVFCIPVLIGCLLSWELLFYIPMSKFLINIIINMFSGIWRLNFSKLALNNPKSNDQPAILIYYSGSFMYFKYEIYNFEVAYLSLWPLVIATLYTGYSGHSKFIKEHYAVPAAIIAVIATIPCMYVIGICTEMISSKLGLVLGSLLNALFTGFVELFLFALSLKKNMVQVVSAGLTGAFLMNLLVIPGVSMLSAGIKWNEVKVNKRVQSVSGTILFLATISLFLPSIYYHLYKHTKITCNECNGLKGVFNIEKLNTNSINCSDCSVVTVDNYLNDPTYFKSAKQLMYAASVLMPLLYGVGLFFSLHTHKHIYNNLKSDEHNEVHSLNTFVCMIILCFACVLFCFVCEIVTDELSIAKKSMNLTDRFVGLIFYTIIPAIAEFINAIRFATEGNIGLSLEISNQGALAVSLIQIPALIFISMIMGFKDKENTFTLIFEIIDVFAIIISVLIRNFLFLENSINYFTGFSFLLMFTLITLVYYYDMY